MVGDGNQTKSLRKKLKEDMETIRAGITLENEANNHSHRTLSMNVNLEI